MPNATQVNVLPYDPNWGKQFIQEAHHLSKRFPGLFLDLIHVGSTSVPDLCAKPIIDVVGVVSDVQALTPLSPDFESLGYDCRGELGLPFRRYFTKKGRLSVNLHVYPLNHPEIDRLCLFRQYLIDHPEAKTHYARLKQQLARQFPLDVNAYCNGKTDFILEIDGKSGYNGLRMAHACTDFEWKSWQALAKFSPIPLPNAQGKVELLPPESLGFIPMVLYLKNAIIGIAYVQVSSDETSLELKALVMDKEMPDKGWAAHFLAQLKEWAHHRHQIFKSFL